MPRPFLFFAATYAVATTAVVSLATLLTAASTVVVAAPQQQPEQPVFSPRHINAPTALPAAASSVAPSPQQQHEGHKVEEGQDAMRFARAPLRFAELAPQQKKLGLMHAMGLLRVKVSLLNQMARAAEPNGQTQLGGQQSLLPPGPILAYIDCRLGVLSFDICRHLGFLAVNPVLPPSSFQGQMMRLPEAAALVSSFAAGQLNLMEDQDLLSIMSQEVLQLAVRALRACWEAQLLQPTFDMRSAAAGYLHYARMETDRFILYSVMKPGQLPPGLELKPEDGEELAWMVSAMSRSTGTEQTSGLSAEASAAGHSSGSPVSAPLTEGEAPRETRNALRSDNLIAQQGLLLNRGTGGAGRQSPMATPLASISGSAKSNDRGDNNGNANPAPVTHTEWLSGFLSRLLPLGQQQAVSNNGSDTNQLLPAQALPAALAGLASTIAGLPGSSGQDASAQNELEKHIDQIVE